MYFTEMYFSEFIILSVIAGFATEEETLNRTTAATAVRAEQEGEKYPYDHRGCTARQDSL